MKTIQKFKTVAMLVMALVLTFASTATAAPKKAYAATNSVVLTSGGTFGDTTHTSSGNTSTIGTTNADGSTSFTIKDVVKWVINILCGIFAIIGIITVIPKIPSAIEAMQNQQDPTAMKKAAGELVVPIVMIFLPALIAPLLNAIL